MNDLTTDQIIQIGQMYFPEMDAQKILDIFEQFRAIMPKGSTNLEIAQVIKMTVDDNKKNPTRMGNLRQILETK